MLDRVLTRLLLVPALTLCLISPALAEGKKLALLVGVEQYKHADLTPLKFCCDDVKKMAGVLTAQGFTCRVLADEGFDAKLATSKPKTGATGPLPSQGLPTRAAITTELKSLLKDVGKDDLVLIVLSGHGLQPEGATQPYFCPLDANPSVRLETVSNPGGGRLVRKLTRPETLVGIGDLLGQLKESGVGQKLILVDACRNSPSSKGSKSVGASSVSINLIPEMCSVLMSCSAGEQSFEDRKFGPEGGGAFLTAVMEGLEGQAADAEGAVSWDGLVAHVKKRVKSSVDAAYNGTEKQTPNQIQNSSADPVLARIDSTNRRFVEKNGIPGARIAKVPLDSESKSWKAFLDTKVECDFVDLPIRDAVESLFQQVQFGIMERKDLQILFDERAIDADGIFSLDDPITLKLSGASLRLVLSRLLKPKGWGWYVEENVLTITTQTELDVREELSKQSR